LDNYSDDAAEVAEGGLQAGGAVPTNFNNLGFVGHVARERTFRH
jgi:hypothetical protein